MITLEIKYFSILRETSNKEGEVIQTRATNPAELYEFINSKYCFPIQSTQLKVAINNEFVDWNTKLKEGDVVVFIPPISGG